jgi:acyl transferase domain-containing protein
LRWQAFLRRFDLEHTFRLFKQTLGWTVPRVRDPHTADLWTWLIIAAHTQLRLARPLAEDLRRPWERPAEPRRLTPARVRRGFRHLRVKTARPAGGPKPSRPGPERPLGSKNRRSAPRHEPGKTVKRAGTLTGLLRAESGQHRPCYVSSSKALIGHTLSAAGAAGLVKAALALHHGVVPPQPTEIRANGELALDAAGLRLTTEPQPWPHDDIRRAGISSFGFGGTNVHAVLESAPLPPPTVHEGWPVAEPAADATAHSGAGPAHQREDEPWLFLLSAGSVPDLARHTEEIRRFVAGTPNATTAAIARTLALRELLTARLAVVAATREELLDLLELAARRLAEGALGELAPGLHATAAPLPAEERKVAFAFPGQGSQRPGMLADLVRRFPLLAERAAELAKFTAEESETLPQTLAGLLWGRHEPDDEDAQAALTVTDVCQPGLGITGVSTTQLLAACGVEPAITIGHSVGEFPTAVAAGAFDGRDAVAFMARRGAALAAAVPAGTGAMLAVQAPIADADQVAAGVEGVWPACYNHGGQLVFSGDAEALQHLHERCAEQHIAAVRLKVSHAFHSPLVAAADEAMTQTIAALPLTAPTRTYVSSVSGQVCEQPQEIKHLWARHNTAAVRFIDAVRSVADAGARFLVQLYGGDTLLRMARRNEAGAGLDLLPLTTEVRRRQILPDGARPARGSRSPRGPDGPLRHRRLATAVSAPVTA